MNKGSFVVVLVLNFVIAVKAGAWRLLGESLKGEHHILHLSLLDHPEPKGEPKE